MIDIKIGSVTDDNRVVHKTFNERMIITGEINFPCDILNPELIVSRDIILNSDNYCYIPYFGRYYFINNIIHNGKTKTLQLSVDVLKTYENELQEIDVNVIRNSGEATEIIDNKLPINNNSYWIEGKYFPIVPWNITPTTVSDNIVLTVITSGGIIA